MRTAVLVVVLVGLAARASAAFAFVARSTTCRRRYRDALLLERIEAAHASKHADAVNDALCTNGVVRIDGAIDVSVADELLTYVNGALEEALRSSRDSIMLDAGDNYVQYFGNVLARQDLKCGTTRRHDLKLDLTPPVEAALKDLLTNFGPALSECLGADAVLYELAALISDPGAPAQPFHPDTPFLDEQGVAVLTAFVALQPIDETMGPTRFLPASHTAEDHAAFNARDDDGAAMLTLLRSRPCDSGLLGQGDATLFDSRLLHCGTANVSPRRRVLFYASFRARDAKAPPGTLLYDLRERHSLQDWSSCWA